MTDVIFTLYTKRDTHKEREGRRGQERDRDRQTRIRHADNANHSLLADDMRHIQSKKLIMFKALRNMIELSRVTDSER